MTTEEIKTVMRRYCEEFCSQGKLDIADEIIGEGYGAERLKKSYGRHRKSFPDLHREVHDLVVEGEKVVVYSTFTGTHTGEGGSVPFPVTGEKVEKPTVAAYIVRDGKIEAEPWGNQANDRDLVQPIAKAVIRRWIEEVWNKGDLSVADAILGPDYVLHDPAMPGIQGVNGAKELIRMSREAVPDLITTIEDLAADGDRVVARWAAEGHHEGELLGVPPTGKQITMSGTSIYRFSEGKLVEEWKHWDALGLYQQLGTYPEM